MYLEIIRLRSTQKVTMGALLVNSKLMCFTLEPPWRMNEKGKSCIPVGEYVCQKYRSKKFETMCLKLFDVYGRENIAIHPGNSVEETKGCILPGLMTGGLHNNETVLQSRLALDTIVTNLAHQYVSYNLIIKNGF